MVGFDTSSASRAQGAILHTLPSVSSNTDRECVSSSLRHAFRSRLGKTRNSKPPRVPRDDITT